MSDKGYALILIYIFTFFIGILMGTITDRFIWHKKAVEHSYGLYCPDTGKFAWKDECGVEK